MPVIICLSAKVQPGFWLSLLIKLTGADILIVLSSNSEHGIFLHFLRSF
jgi:hypothetical protein